MSHENQKFILVIFNSNLRQFVQLGMRSEKERQINRDKQLKQLEDKIQHLNLVI